MNAALLAFVREALARPVSAEVRAFGEALARDSDAAAVLFYGSALRSGDLDGVLDYYVLTRAPPQSLLDRWLWPRVGYRHLELDGRPLRAKVATLPLATFGRACAGRTLDTTLWTRFVQPAALVFAADAGAASATIEAVAAACETAASYAAALGPSAGPAEDFWTALFRRTYRAELRVETPGREREIVGYDPARYAALLPLAWTSAGLGVEREGEALRPDLSAAERRRRLSAWRRREALGKPLNVARLMKAAFTFDGAARYAAWKIERHTGVAVPLTPWRERHPILAAPGVALRLWRAKRRQPDAR